MTNAIDWFEIFVSDLDRAVAFYQTTLALDLKREAYADRPTAVFPGTEGVSGALVHDPARATGPGGSLLYLNATGKLDACLSRAVPAGGAVVMPKTDIGPPGFIAIVRDTEGNLVGLHSER
jgi:predicted enzyme related to lactoylglutathione lyase